MKEGVRILKRGRMPEKEGDCMKKREIYADNYMIIIAIWQFCYNFLVQFLVFFVVISPS